MKDFFISYTRIDRSWAEWVAWQLEENGYSVVIQAWDFRPGNNFVVEMQKAAAEADRTIPILSSDYLAARFTLPEWSAAFAQDPTGEQGKLVPVKVAECNPQGLLPQLIYIDLVGKAEQAARETLLAGVKKGRNKPGQPPGFPAVRPPRKEGTEQPNFPQASGMPELERHVELFRAADILEAIPDLADDIVGRIKLASSGAVLLDNSTIEYAFEALSGGPSDSASKVLPSKKWVIANSVVELIDALVLQETVIAGPAGQEAWYAREDLNAASKLIQRPDQQIGDKALFGLLSLARTRSMDAIRADQELVRSLNRLLEHQLDSELVRRYIGGMSLNASYHSPHYWERLFSKGKAEYYFGDLSSGVLGANTIAMNAVDDENAGRGNWSNDYFAYTAKREGVEFPERESIHEFYAASLLFRTFVYLYLSELLGCMYRGDMLRADLAKTIVGSQKRSTRGFSKVVLDALAAEEEKRDEAVNQLLGVASFQVSLPLVAQAVLTRAKNAEEILKVALEMRASKQAERFRAFCKTVDQAIARGNRLEVEQAIRELQEFGLDLARAQFKDKPTLQGPQELISYGSTLLTTILETAKHPVRSLRGRLGFHSLAFLDTLRSTPRSFGILDGLLA